MFLGAVVSQHTIIFNVDMNDEITGETFDSATDVLYVAGSIPEWAEPGTNPAFQMIDPDEDGIYTIIVAGILDGEVAYKYFADVSMDIGWGSGEWEGDPNRILTLPVVTK